MIKIEMRPDSGLAMTSHLCVSGEVDASMV